MKRQAYYIRLAAAGIIFILILLSFIFKFYPAKLLDIQFSALLQRVFIDFSIITIILIFVILASTLLFGRLYCSTICPFGFLQEIASLIFKNKNETQKNYQYKYFIAAVSFGLLIGGSTAIIKFIDPYTIFGSAVTFTIYGLLFTIVILSLVFFKNRFFCSNICPVGTILGLIAKNSYNKIYMSEKCISCGICEKNCPSGCIDPIENVVDNERCIKCMKCMSVCPKEAMQYGLEPKKETKFNLKRRELIISATIVTIFGGAIKTGIEISKNIGKKLKGMILPPGAESEQRILNKCLNCNLCVANCPNQIIQKADKDFNAIHIDYEKGKKHCKYNCNTCAEVCPSGAIKRITKKEKQKTRIAIAKINQETCQKCGICSYDCPVNAIEYKAGNTAVVDSSKCIGCGQCKASCPNNAIEIYSVNKQQYI